MKLYNAATRKSSDDKANNSNAFVHGLVLAELVCYIQDTKLDDNSVAPIFKLNDLVQLYRNDCLNLMYQIKFIQHV